MNGYKLSFLCSMEIVSQWMFSNKRILHVTLSLLTRLAICYLRKAEDAHETNTSESKFSATSTESRHSITTAEGKTSFEAKTSEGKSSTVEGKMPEPILTDTTEMRIRIHSNNLRNNCISVAITEICKIFYVLNIFETWVSNGLCCVFK